MRQIKFRVWDNVDYMSKSFTLSELKKGGIQWSSECPVMQFTGFQDKNGVDIYEGDLVREYGNSFVETGAVSFIHGCWMVANKSGERYFNLHWFLSRAEVIGNIHQNPELLGDI